MAKKLKKSKILGSTETTETVEPVAVEEVKPEWVEASLEGKTYCGKIIASSLTNGSMFRLTDEVGSKYLISQDEVTQFVK